MIVDALKALIGDVYPLRGTTHTRQPPLRSMAHGEESLGNLLVSSRSGSKAEARYNPRWVDSHKQAKTFVPSQRRLDHPMSAYPASHPLPLRLASRTGMAELSRAS
jgi:hypothetical protein